MDRIRTIANPRELDPSFSVPCRRCAGLLQEWNRFCPFCLEDQFPSVGADTDPDGDAASATTSSRDNSASNANRDLGGVEFADTVHPSAAELFPFSTPAGGALNARKDTDLFQVQPSGHRETELLGVGSKALWTTHLSPDKLKTGIAVLLISIAVGLVGLKQGYFDTRSAVKIDIERAQTALNRGDLSSAGQLLDAIESKYLGDSGVQSLRDALDLRIRERSTWRSEPLDTTAQIAPNASASEDSIPVALVAPDQAAAGLPDQPTGLPRAAQKECSVALAALALCPKQ